MRKYTAYSYMKKLERCLRKMPYEEREDAINYYSEYFAEAGQAREQEIINRLGPPQRVAAEIKADFALRGLNSKATRAKMAKELRKARKKEKKAGAVYKYEYRNDAPDSQGGAGYTGGSGGAQGGAGYAGGSGGAQGGAGYTGGSGGAHYGAGSAGGSGGAQGGAGYADGSAGAYYAEDSQGANKPSMREGIAASWHGAIGMLAMPIARPLAVLACVLGIIGLILCIIVVVAIYIGAGVLAISGCGALIISLFLSSVNMPALLFAVGLGLSGIALGLIIGVLNYLLGRTIFKGIANLSGMIRHKRVKVKKEFFGNPYEADTGIHRYGADATYSNGGRK